MIHVSRSEWKRMKALAEGRKAKREEKRTTLPWAKHKKKRGPLPRRAAFNRMEENCKLFVKLRAKHRTGGFCEVGLACGGHGAIECWYHIFAQELGNALKYEDENILGACMACNGGEYIARKRGSDLYRDRHVQILGQPKFDELKARAGRKEISTAEAIAKADFYETKIRENQWTK